MRPACTWKNQKKRGPRGAPSPAGAGVAAVLDRVVAHHPPVEVAGEAQAPERASSRRSAAGAAGGPGRGPRRGAASRLKFADQAMSTIPALRMRTATTHTAAITRKRSAAATSGEERATGMATLRPRAAPAGAGGAGPRRGGGAAGRRARKSGEEDAGRRGPPEDPVKPRQAELAQEAGRRPAGRAATRASGSKVTRGAPKQALPEADEGEDERDLQREGEVVRELEPTWFRRNTKPAARHRTVVAPRTGRGRGRSPRRGSGRASRAEPLREERDEGVAHAPPPEAGAGLAAALAHARGRSSSRSAPAPAGRRKSLNRRRRTWRCCRAPGPMSQHPAGGPRKRRRADFRRARGDASQGRKRARPKEVP